MATEPSAWESSIANFCGMETSDNCMYAEDNYNTIEGSKRDTIFIVVMYTPTFLQILFEQQLNLTGMHLSIKP